MPQSPPPMKPAKNIIGTMIYEGSASPKVKPVQDANAAPMSNCPSAPMFQNLALKARVRPAPINIRGMALVRVSLNPYMEPKEPENISLMAKTGLTPAMRKIMLMTSKPAKSDRILVIKDRSGVMLYRSVVIIFIMALSDPFPMAWNIFQGQCVLTQPSSGQSGTDVHHLNPGLP